MERKRRVLGPDGQEHEATELTFQAGGEHWNEYLVDDGTVVRVKLVATDIVRLDDVYDEQGNPVYLLRSTNVMSVSAPDHLRRKEA